MNGALQAAPKDADVLANALVLNTVLGKSKEAADLRTQLEEVDPAHDMVVEHRRRAEAFEASRGKWSPKFEIEA